MRSPFIVATLLAIALRGSSSFVILPNGQPSPQASVRLRNEISTRVNPIPTLYASRNENPREDGNELASLAGEIAKDTGKLLVKATKAGANFLQEAFKEGKKVAASLLDGKKEAPFVDTEDEDLFNDLFAEDRMGRVAYPKDTESAPPEDPIASKIYVNAEVMEGVRVTGFPGSVIDAEIIDKRFL